MQDTQLLVSILDAALDIERSVGRGTLQLLVPITRNNSEPIEELQANANAVDYIIRAEELEDGR